MILPRDFGRKFSEKGEFSNKILHCLKFSKFGDPRGSECHFNLQREYAMCSTDGVDAFFESDQPFLMDLLTGTIRKKITLRHVDSSKDFYTVLHKQEKDTGLHDAH